MNTSLRRLLRAAAVLALIGCGPPPGASGGGLPPGASPMGAPASRDPVGFLLQFRDSIGIDDATTQSLVQLNLRLFRRNREAQLHLDTIMRGAPLEHRPTSRGDSLVMPDSVRDRAAPWRDLIRTQTLAVKDTAWAMLNEQQRLKATQLEERMMANRTPVGPSLTPGRP